ncbi:uncharacterized protein LOC135480136 [Liolophura sinensis]|uniref:uncharacterized protein LOC135480136 n=1 Tax=Liolophura sinensis TaxID=3198878 RepID=UPI0031591C2F
MTGTKMAQESDFCKLTYPEGDLPSRGERRRPVLIAAIASLSTALVLGSIVFGVIFYLQQNKAEKPEWISWVRNAGDVDIHESVLINDKEKTILMVSAEAYRIHEENSMALHDFKLGYVALRDFGRGMCLVTQVKIPDFRSVKQMLEDRRGKTLDLQPLKQGEAQLRNMTSSELGPILSKFCDGVPAHWFDVKETAVEKRAVDPRQQGPPRLDEPILACLHIRCELPS